MDRGALALQVNEGRAKLVHLPDPPASETVLSRKVDVTLGGDGGATVDWHAEVTGAYAAEYRQRYHSEVSRKQRLTEDLGADLGGLAITSLEAPSLDDVEQPVSLHVRAAAREFGQKTGNQVSLSVGPREHLVRDLAPLSQRRLDVRLPFRSRAESEWTVRLPTATRIVRAPDTADVRGQFGSVTVQVEQLPGAVHVKTVITLERSRIGAVEYPAFRAWCESADRALGQRLVLSK